MGTRPEQRKLFLAARMVLPVLTLLVSTAKAQTTKADLVVDFGNSASVSSLSGILHGFNGFGAQVDIGRPPADLVDPIRPANWRMSYTALNSQAANPQVYTYLRGRNVPIQFVLSDLWGYPNDVYGWPYENYGAWEQFVRGIARANRGLELMWDVWNEPADPSQPYRQFWPGTIDQFFETYRRAYVILREELGSTAVVGGGSFVYYDVDIIQKFFDFCLAHQLEVNFLSWHELNDGDIVTIPSRLTSARIEFINNPKYSTLNIHSIQINEIIGNMLHYSPRSVRKFERTTTQPPADGLIQRLPVCRAACLRIGQKSAQ